MIHWPGIDPLAFQSYKFKVAIVYFSSYRFTILGLQMVFFVGWISLYSPSPMLYFFFKCFTIFSCNQIVVAVHFCWWGIQAHKQVFFKFISRQRFTSSCVKGYQVCHDKLSLTFKFHGQVFSLTNLACWKHSTAGRITCFGIVFGLLGKGRVCSFSQMTDQFCNKLANYN